jgi:ribosomal protein S18 acetylase RimI-like enzyme
MSTVPRSLVWATSIDVLGVDHVVERRDDHLLVRSPSSPSFYWGNLLLFDVPPGPGDGERWESIFADTFADEPRVRHVTLAWDGPDAPLGSAQAEFVPRGYDLDSSVGLVATPADLRQHQRANQEVTVRALDPDADEDLWTQVIDVQVGSRTDHFEEAPYREFALDQQAAQLQHFRAGRGAWYVALDGDAVVGSCGVIVTDGRGRFRAVDTLATHRRRGVSSRLVVDAAQHAAKHHGADRFVIVADEHYHALGLYESLGFARVERVFGVCRPPQG